MALISLEGVSLGLKLVLPYRSSRALFDQALQLTQQPRQQQLHLSNRSITTTMSSSTRTTIATPTTKLSSTTTTTATTTTWRSTQPNRPSWKYCVSTTWPSCRPCWRSLVWTRCWTRSPTDLSPFLCQPIQRSTSSSTRWVASWPELKSWSGTTQRLREWDFYFNHF